MGLLLGGSIISVVEIMDFIIMRALKSHKEKKSSQNNSNGDLCAENGYVVEPIDSQKMAVEGELQNKQLGSPVKVMDSRSKGLGLETKLGSHSTFF